MVPVSDVPPAVDLLRWPLIGPFLRWRRARTALQLGLLGVAVVVVVHGLLGPAFAPANLATVLTWVHYRGLLVIALLAVGNLFCTACPMMLARDWGRRWRTPRWKWPARLRGKWLAVAAFVAVLFTYELFDLWSLPRATAWLVIGYFAAALVVDLLFSGATFCKHLCPIGQFNFLASTVSPLEVRPRDLGTCGSCRTEDCIAGRRDLTTGAVTQRGCELGLFLPSKVGNLDCTLCLDCVQACPHDNVVVTPRVPGLELADGRRRSGIGVLAERTDLAALAGVFVFGAMLNAFAMTASVRGVEAAVVHWLGVTTDLAVLGTLFAVGLLVVPVVALGGAAAATRALAGGEAGALRAIAQRQVFGLVPLGLSIWLAHYGFHLLTGFLVVVPLVQNAVVEAAGVAWLGEPLWRWTGMRPGAVWPLQIGVVLLGTLGSLAVTALIADRQPGGRRTRAAAPWHVLVIILALLTLWTFLQPMEMRGTGVAG